MKITWKRRRVTRGDGQADGRIERREGRLEATVAMLAQAPRTIDEIADSLRCSRRTAYILLREIEGRGRTVARTGPKTLGRWTLL